MNYNRRTGWDWKSQHQISRLFVVKLAVADEFITNNIDTFIQIRAILLVNKKMLLKLVQRAWNSNLFTWRFACDSQWRMTITEVLALLNHMLHSLSFIQWQFECKIAAFNFGQWNVAKRYVLINFISNLTHQHCTKKFSVTIFAQFYFAWSNQLIEIARWKIPANTERVWRKNLLSRFSGCRWVKTTIIGLFAINKWRKIELKWRI